MANERIVPPLSPESPSPPPRPSLESVSSRPPTLPDYSSYDKSSPPPSHLHPRRDSNSSQPLASYFHGTAEAPVPATIVQEPESFLHEPNWHPNKERSSAQDSVPFPQTPYESPPLSPTSSIAPERYGSRPYPTTSPYAPSSHSYTHSPPHPNIQIPNNTSLLSIHSQLSAAPSYRPTDPPSHSAPGNQAPEYSYPDSPNTPTYSVRSNRQPSLSSLSVSSYSPSLQTPTGAYDSFEALVSRNMSSHQDGKSVEREVSQVFDSQITKLLELISTFFAFFAFFARR